MESKGSLPRSQDLAADPYLGPDEFRPQLPTLLV